MVRSTNRDSDTDKRVAACGSSRIVLPQCEEKEKEGASFHFESHAANERMPKKESTVAGRDHESASPSKRYGHKPVRFARIMLTDFG